MKNVNIQVLGVRVHEKPIYRGGGGGGLPRRGELRQFIDLRGGLTK